MVQGQTAQKFFAFDEGDVWRHGLRRRFRDSVTIVERASLVASNICTDGSGKQKRAQGQQLGLNEMEKY